MLFLFLYLEFFWSSSRNSESSSCIHNCLVLDSVVCFSMSLSELSESPYSASRWQIRWIQALKNHSFCCPHIYWRDSYWASLVEGRLAVIAKIRGLKKIRVEVLQLDFWVPYLALASPLTFSKTWSKLVSLCLRFIICKIKIRKSMYFRWLLCGTNKVLKQGALGTVPNTEWPVWALWSD